MSKIDFKQFIKGTNKLWKSSAQRAMSSIPQIFASPHKKPKHIRTKSDFDTLPLVCLLRVFRFLHSAHLLNRWKELYILKETTDEALMNKHGVSTIEEALMKKHGVSTVQEARKEEAEEKYDVLHRSNFNSLLSVNGFSVHFDLHRQQYQHLRVNRALLRQDVNTRERIYAYFPVVCVYSTLAVSRLPKPKPSEDWSYYICCPRDQQHITLTSYEPYISRGEDQEEVCRNPDLVLTNLPVNYDRVYCNLPDPNYRIVVDSDYTMNPGYGFICTGDIVDGVVTGYVRCDDEQEAIKLDTWIDDTNSRL